VAREQPAESIPLARKLGIVSGMRLLLGGEAPADFTTHLAPLPEGVHSGRWPDDHPRGPADVIVYFARSATALTVEIVALGAALKPAGALWVVWPKKSARGQTDLDEDVVRAVALPIGLVDSKGFALDGAWFGLRLHWRKGNRGK
jgi:hypothetical protein